MTDLTDEKSGSTRPLRLDQGIAMAEEVDRFKAKEDMGNNSRRCSWLAECPMPLRRTRRRPTEEGAIHHNRAPTAHHRHRVRANKLPTHEDPIRGLGHC